MPGRENQCAECRWFYYLNDTCAACGCCTLGMRNWLLGQVDTPGSDYFFGQTMVEKAVRQAASKTLDWAYEHQREETDPACEAFEEGL